MNPGLENENKYISHLFFYFKQKDLIVTNALVSYAFLEVTAKP